MLALLTGSADTASVAPADRERPWWGMGDMVLWFFVGQLAVGLAYFAAVSVGGYSLLWPDQIGSAAGESTGRIGAGQAPFITKTVSEMPFVVFTLTQLVPQWVGFIGGPIYAAKRKGTSLAHDFGLRVDWKHDLPLGLAIGVVAQVVLVTVLYKVIFVFVPEQDVSAGARSLTDRATTPATAVILFLVVAIGAPFCEELFFRGLSQRAIAKRLGPIWGIVLTAVFFALVHGKLLELPGLFMFGLILSYLAFRYDRLGPSIFAHIGFNAVTAVLLLWNSNLS